MDKSSLAPLLNKAIDIHAMPQADILQRSIARSGLTLEARLRAAAAQIKLANSNLSNPAGNPLRQNMAAGTSDKVSATQVQQILRENTVPYDLKTALLQLLNGSSAINLSPKNQDQLMKALQTLMPGLGQQDLAKMPKLELEQRINTSIRNIALSGIARITGMQLRHLLSSIQETNTSGAGGMYELPIKIGDAYYPVVLHIQERFQREKDSEEKDENAQEKKKPKLKSSWHVYLEFDLDEYGIFASDITLIDTKIKTQFWVQQNPLWHKSKSHLNELRKALEEAGIHVEEMSCSCGSPPQKSMNLQHALVDIRT